MVVGLSGRQKHSKREYGDRVNQPIYAYLSKTIFLSKIKEILPHSLRPEGTSLLRQDDIRRGGNIDGVKDLVNKALGFYLIFFRMRLI